MSKPVVVMNTDCTSALRMDDDVATVVVTTRCGVPLCVDFDEDCHGLDHLHCYLYDPGKGRCPYLSQGKLFDPLGGAG